jgi:hypothetical protein
LDVRVLQAEMAGSEQAQWDEIRAFIGAYAAQQPVRKVAVVGNAPLQPDVDRAAELDSSDLVFRANSMILDEPGDPPCVGRACHVVILSRSTRLTRWCFQDYRKRAYLVPQMGFPLYYGVRPRPDFWPADLGAMPIPNKAVKQRIADRLDPNHEPGSITPTSGTAALYLAHEMFPDADLVATGFSFLDSQPQSEWAHHSGGSTAVNKHHDLGLEGALLRSWIDDGSVRFFE